VTTEARAERLALLSMLPATRTERRWALGLVLLFLLLFAAAVPFARVPLKPMMAFIPSYEAALVINDIVTAILLFSRFATARSAALLVLAGGYFFTALMAAIHALSFPGLYADTGLLGAGPQSTAWLYMFWHGGFPLAVIVYAGLRRGGDMTERERRGAGLAIAAALVVVAGLVAGLAALATAGHDGLPVIMAGDHYTPVMIFVVSTVWLLTFVALLVLSRLPQHAVLDLWLMVVMAAWLFDIGLSAVLNGGRFDLGFYAGRIFGLVAASFILIMLLVEISVLYTRLVRSMEIERQERERRLEQVQSELIHVGRLSEMGQMVSALAHEVTQPLTAIGNYIRAAQRLIELGEPLKLRATLEKGADQVMRAVQIIQHLRDYVKKAEAERKVEDLSEAIDEAWALAVISARHRPVDVRLDLDPEASWAFIDKIQIQQVLLNVMRNAIEAMAESPRCALVIASEPATDGMIEITIADTGPGIAEAVRAKLFQPFVTTKAEGMGVGLSICHSIIEAHGGRLWATPNPGGGTVFHFTVQTASPPEAMVQDQMRGVA